jgi:exonuclease SbcC
MGCNESNFIYLRTTSMGKYYDELVKAESIGEYFPMITKIIVRKVLEGVLKNIAEKYSIESTVSVWNLLNNIKFNYSLSLPEEIYNYIEIVLVNGYEHDSSNNKNKKSSKHYIEVLETMHNILCWYLKKSEPQKMTSIKDLNFKAPSTIEYHQKEVDKIKDDILLKDNQINNLRQKIIELSSQSKSVRELNKIIIAIKEERAHLEAAQVLLTKKIQVQKDQVAHIEKNYKTYIKKINELQEKCNENQQFIFNKESQLVKTEIQKQELKNLDKELDEQEESIRRSEQFLESELKTVRKAYEHLVNLTIQYQDILETLEFSYDKELQKTLEIQKNNVKMEINFEDRIFNENITSYTKNMAEAKRKIIIFKEILNEKIKREIKYGPFYRGFLRLEDKQLRIIYTMVTNINTKSNFINKSKELLLKSSEDKFLESINRNLEELKNINDDEMKLVLYYKLIKLSQVSLGNIYNRRQFIQVLDSMVDRAYEILIPKKDFSGKIRKLDAMITYYLGKAIADLKNKSSNLQINEELVDKIYKKIITLKQNAENIGKEKIYYDKFNLDNMSESMLRTSIKSQPFTFLSIMIDLGEVASYKGISSIIFEVENFIAKRPSIKGYEKGNFTISFSNEYFMIFLFLSSGITSLNQKQQEELLPLLIIVIMSVDLIADNEVINLENYNRMVELWKRKQEKYNDIFIEKEDKESELKSLIKEKQELEINYENLLKTHEVLSQNYNSYKEEFKKIVMNSEKRILLPSFREYDKLRIKKEEAEEHINESKNKFGTLKSILSPEVWKDQANKFINESNIMELEKSLIQEAKQKPYFKEEYQVFIDLKEKIEETNKLINKEKENLKNKNLLIDDIKIKINELLRQLNNIKDVYLDIEEGYY